MYCVYETGVYEYGLYPHPGGIEFSRTKQVVPGMIFYGVEFFSVVSSFRTTASKEKNENRENFQRHRKYTPYILLENTW